MGLIAQIWHETFKLFKRRESSSTFNELISIVEGSKSIDSGLNYYSNPHPTEDTDTTPADSVSEDDLDDEPVQLFDEVHEAFNARQVTEIEKTMPYQKHTAIAAIQTNIQSGLKNLFHTIITHNQPIFDTSHKPFNEINNNIIFMPIIDRTRGHTTLLVVEVNDNSITSAHHIDSFSKSRSKLTGRSKSQTHVINTALETLKLYGVTSNKIKPQRHFTGKQPFYDDSQCGYWVPAHARAIADHLSKPDNNDLAAAIKNLRKSAKIDEELQCGDNLTNDSTTTAQAEKISWTRAVATVLLLSVVVIILSPILFPLLLLSFAYDLKIALGNFFQRSVTRVAYKNDTGVSDTKTPQILAGQFDHSSRGDDAASPVNATGTPIPTEQIEESSDTTSRPH